MSSGFGTVNTLNADTGWLKTVPAGNVALWPGNKVMRCPFGCVPTRYGENANDDKSTVPPLPYELAPADWYDPVIEAYKKDVDRTLLRENLKLTVDQRFRQFESFMNYLYELRGAANRTRNAS